MSEELPTSTPPPAGRGSGVVRKVVVGVTGGTVVLVGVAMIVLPGPAVVVIPAGLALLATEFVWARRLLDKSRARLAQVARGVKGRSTGVQEKPTGPGAGRPG